MPSSPGHSACQILSCFPFFLREGGDSSNPSRLVVRLVSKSPIDRKVRCKERKQKGPLPEQVLAAERQFRQDARKESCFVSTAGQLVLDCFVCNPLE